MSMAVVVIGAGLGGLSAAIELAASGAQVTVIEALDRAGGKAGVFSVDGVSFDTGPSLLTLPEIAYALLDRAPGGRARLLRAALPLLQPHVSEPQAELPHYVELRVD